MAIRKKANGHYVGIFNDQTITALTYQQVKAMAQLLEILNKSEIKNHPESQHLLNAKHINLN